MVAHLFNLVNERKDFVHCSRNFQCEGCSSLSFNVCLNSVLQFSFPTDCWSFTLQPRASMEWFLCHKWTMQCATFHNVKFEILHYRLALHPAWCRFHPVDCSSIMQCAKFYMSSSKFYFAVATFILHSAIFQFQPTRKVPIVLQI